MVVAAGAEEVEVVGYAQVVDQPGIRGPVRPHVARPVGEWRRRLVVGVPNRVPRVVFRSRYNKMRFWG